MLKIFKYILLVVLIPVYIIALIDYDICSKAISLLEMSKKFDNKLCNKIDDFVRTVQDE